MQIKAMKTFRHGSTMIRRGSSVEMVETHARDLVKRGLAEEVANKSAVPKSEPPKPEPRVKR